MLASYIRRQAAPGDGPTIGQHPPQEGSSASEVRAELQRVLNSSQFDASERNRRFLEYVIEEKLAGRAGRIKAYTIATQVFGRDVNFDPQLDPVVRMEARRLRRSLERFYLTDGKNSSVRIAMPKGGYVPEFRHLTIEDAFNVRAISLQRPGKPRAEECVASIMVATFDAEGDESIFLHFNRGFTDQLVVALSRFAEISVYESGAIRRTDPFSARDWQQAECGVDFILSGSAALFDGVLNIKAVLTLAATGRVIWARTFEQKLRSGYLLQIRDDIANMIVRTLAGPYGVIFTCKARSAEAAASDHLIRFYNYKRSYRRDLHSQVRLLLENLVADNPGYAEACGCLSQIYSDGYRFGFVFNESPATLLMQAAEFAERAVELAPESSRGHHARGVARWLLNDASESIEALKAAVALNPNATEVMAELGWFHSLMGDWDRGIALLEEAFARNPAEVGARRIGLSLFHFMNGRPAEALAEARQVNLPDVAYAFVAKAVSLIRLGREAEAADAIRRIAEIARYSGGAVLADLGVEGVSPLIARDIMMGLEDAGLPRGIVLR